MRLGVLDVGSTTVHLLVVDAYRGAHPTPMSSEKTVLQLAEQLTPEGLLSDKGVELLVNAVTSSKELATRFGCADLLAFATSAVREAVNSADVLARVHHETGVSLRVLSGEAEAAYTFLAARRWYGWSAGQLLVLDIGGGSFEIAIGRDEIPDFACSLPLGASRITRDRFRSDPPSHAEIADTVSWLDEQLAPVAKQLKGVGVADRAVATSKTFRTLARLTGAAPSAAGPRVRRELTAAGLRQLIAFISRISATELAQLEGVNTGRAHQLAAGALVAEAAMRSLSLTELEICPWALREGVILNWLDHTDGTETGRDTGPNAQFEAPWWTS